MIEHHTDFIGLADWVIDLGPGGGTRGGEIVYAGDVKGLKKCKRSETGLALKRS